MLEVRLARLALPLPLELSIRRALVFPDRAAQHEGLVLSWELSLRILAGSMWAACREIGATSPALETAAKNLDRPSFGHWAELARTCATLLRGRTEPAAAAFATTLAGLEQPLPPEGGLRQLTERIAALPAKNAPKPRRIQELLDSLPFYRNTAQSTHGDVPPQFREESVPALLEGLIDFCERVPLTGALTLIFVRRLERAAAGHVAEIARMTGNSVSWSTRTLDESLWTKLAPARPYLFHEPDLVVPLFPMAAVSSSGAEWHVGWYARQVHTPTVVYQGVAGNEFQLVLAPDDLRSLAQRTTAATDVVSQAALALDPYRGLLSYNEEHAAIFHGREEETEAALARIQQRATLFVFGASGSGKSSWLKAGVLPALRSHAALSGRPLRAIIVLPGDRPIAALRRALTQARGGTPEDTARWARAVEEALPGATPDAKSGAPAKVHDKALAHLLSGLAALGETPVLVVDQLEEAATASVDPAEGRTFLTVLAAAADSAAEIGAVVLASARADLLGPLIEHAGVRRWLETDGAPVGSIPPERLTRVIVDPLRGRKVSVEPGLAEMIVADVESEPGALALLSQVLTTVWDERSAHGYHLTKQGYVDAGRVSGALEKQAEAALSEVVAAASSDDAAKPARRVDRMFRALAASGEGQRFTRRRVELSALASELATSEDDVRRLADPFVKRRLVVFGGDAGGQRTLEVAHERLLDAWPRLKDLLASEREVIELRREVEHAAEAWRASGGRREQWTDGTSKLRRAEELLASERLDLDERGRAFLAASRAGVRRRKRIERAVLSVVALLAVAASLFGLQAYRSGQRADREAKNALAASKLADSRAEEAARQERIAKATLEDLLSLSAIQDLKDLEARADALWPAHPENLPQYEAWLSDARLLIEGQPADDSKGLKKRASLSEHEAKLAEIRRRAKPRTSEQVEADRRASPVHAEWEKSRSELQWMRRMLGDEAWPSEAEVDAALANEPLPTDANGINNIAWPLVDTDPAKVIHGSEVKALVLAKRAVAGANESERAMFRDTLAWAYFRMGRFNDARAEEQRAVADIEVAKKVEYEGYLAKLEGAITAWIGKNALAERRAETSRLAARVTELQRMVDEYRTFEFEDGEDRWWHAQLSKLVSDLKAFTDEATGGLFSAGISPEHSWGIVKRAEFARTIGERSVSGAEARRRWDEALASIAASPKYGGLQLTPPIGLLPIGVDPESGLWEFAHLQSGDEPERGADGQVRRDEQGRWVLQPGTCIVLVLIPGGTFTMGAQKADPTASNYDPQAGNDETPHEVTLTPYFVSKYEMTQGQWERLSGRNPSQYGPSRYSETWNREGQGWTALHPVEQVTWTGCMELMERAGLELPSEAQWEHAARAGTTSVYWTGDDLASLSGAANLSDAYAKSHGGESRSVWEPDFDDGNTVHAEVGSYRANLYGLHDTHGNVWEWCRDGYDDYSVVVQTDPVAPWIGAQARVNRGGSFNSAASIARSAIRLSNSPETQNSILGLRPARASLLSASPLHPPRK